MLSGEPAIGRRVAVAGLLLFLWAAAVAAQDSSFIRSTDDPTYRIPTFIGNGAFSLVSSPLGTAPSRSFAAGVYDRAPGDVPRIAVLPAWNAFDVSDGSGWLNDVTPDTTTLRAYRQTLDMYAGALHTSYDWIHGANHIAVEVTAFISRADANIAVVRLRLVPRDAVRLTVRFPLKEWPAPQRLALGTLERTERDWTLDRVWYPGHLVATDADSTAMTGRVAGGDTRVAVVQRVVTSPLRNARRTATEVTFDVASGEAVTFTKVVAVVSSRDSSDSARVRPRAAASVREAVAKGYDALLAEHLAAWRRLWETDVVVEGDPQLQRVIHTMVFYLLASARAGTDLSISPMGLSSAGYYGHVFWDADTWMFPALLLMHPDIARSMVTFRARVLPAANRNAQAYGFAGAMYPWESDERGEETTPRFAWQNARSEIHVTGDVALAQWQFYLATGDSTWLARFGEPVLRATADFWVGRATYDSSAGRYSIRNVVSVDEGLIGIGNDAYTNAIARKNLTIAVAASRRVGRAPDPRWTQVADRMYIPYDSAAAYHPTYEGAPPETRGSVVPLLAYPLALPMSDAAKRNDLAHAVQRLLVQGSGAMMTTTLYPVIAAELGDQALIDTLLPMTYRGHLRPPFDALAETPENDAVNFITGAGGFLQQIVYGYSGLRLDESGLRRAFRPLLPSRLTRLTLRNFSVRGRRYDIVVARDSVRFMPR